MKHREGLKTLLEKKSPKEHYLEKKPALPASANLTQMLLMYPDDICVLDHLLTLKKKEAEQAD